MTKENIYHQNTKPHLTKDVSFATPSIIGPYRIESPLSKGGMSILYLASHPETHEPLVVKILSPKYITNKEMVSRFLKEAEIISMTDHPNIIKVFGQGKWEKGLYIAMEFVQGVSLRQFILQKSLSQTKALDIILQVAYALLHLHTHGVIHRDLKPENILITESGKVKVIDFGIAQLHQEEEITSKKSRLIGTPNYMSPEQKENPNKVSFSSDIYSLGIIAYELILGRLSHGVIHLSFLPGSLQKIIEKSLMVNPQDRYQDIVDVISEITLFLKKTRDEIPTSLDNKTLDSFLTLKKDFFSQKAPTWPQIEIGLSQQKAEFMTGALHDFHKLPNDQYLVIIAEPLKEGLSTLLPVAALKGMINALIKSQQNEFHPLTFTHTINRLVALDKQTYPNPFGLSLLLLIPEKDRMVFISCAHSSLYHLPSDSSNYKALTTPNDPIGKSGDSSFLETAANWKSSDLLLLCSMNSKEIPSFDSAISDYIFLSPQVQSEKILSEILSKQDIKSQKNSTAITLHRIF
ncbi:MAG: serine/threonine protein kinase [Chlamydiae bacterium CG10_big_fil_rev_8_21_14_0_10_35_9]|nr:MAG: serine/threonine protein kinase [Chlamydiae bacterium CG10_big_fil_rev_8_21_14_0_10_35_9]